MGEDKALLPHPEGGTLLSRAAALLAGLCDEVWLLSGSGERYPGLALPELEDPLPGLGPLGGIAAALARTDSRPALLVPVDLPALQSEHIRRLRDAFWETEPGLAAAVDSAGRLSALGVWHPRAAARVEIALARERLSLRQLAAGLTVVRVTLPDAALVNWNRPEDRSLRREDSSPPAADGL